MRLWPRTWGGRSAVLLFAAVATLTSYAFSRHTGSSIILRVAAAQQEDLVTAVTGTGTVEPRRTVDIKYDGQDFVDVLNVTEGQRVTRGQVLARMNTQLLEHTRRQNVQVVARDEANLTLAAATLRRANALSAAALLARADLDSAQSAYDALVHQREADQQALLEVETQIDRATLRAPLTGVVTQLYVHQGEMLGSATAVATLGADSATKPTNVLMTIAQDGALEIWADINAMDLGAVSLGQPAQITIDAFRPALFTGRVRTIGLQPTVVNSVTTYQVKVEVPSPDPRWRIGMPVEILLPHTLVSRAVVIPLSALRSHDGHDAVQMIVQGQCARGLADVAVTTIARNTQSAAVRGVAPGDLVVLSGDAIGSDATFQCQQVAVQTNPTLQDLQLTARTSARTTLMPGPKPKSVLQRLFGV